MSGYKAIAAVSSTLRTLLRDRMEDQKPVTIAPPGMKVTNIVGKRVNLFLYQVSQNGFLRNQEIPGHGHPAAYGSPPLSLDLSYLVSVLDPAEGDEITETADLASQQILGDAMRVLHDHAMLHDGMQTRRLLPTAPILDAVLLNQHERVKLYLQPVDLEHLTDLWTSLSVPYRPSAAYEVCVVQIESLTERPVTLPVQIRQVFVQTFRSPQVTEVFREPPLGGVRSAIAATGETLRIAGTNLAAAQTRVILGGVDAPITGDPSDDQIDVRVPATLPAGVHAVEVVHDRNFGTPADPHGGVRSNAVPFMLIPTVTDVAPATAAVGATITATVAPPVHPGQRVDLLLGDEPVRAEPLALAAGATSSTTVDFVLPPPAGRHLLRVRVDGAESRLDYNRTTRAFDGPFYRVT